MAHLIDSYSESNYDAPLPMYAGTNIGRGQSFTGDGKTLDSCKFFLAKVGSPTGNAVAKIYAHTRIFGTNGKPTGAALATSGNFDVSTLTTLNQLITFTFTGENKITLINGTYYVLTIEWNDGDINNRISVGHDHSSPSHSGNYSWFWGSWNANANDDMCFYIYGCNNLTISCLVSSFLLTGKDVALTSVRKITAAVGSFILTGNNILLTSIRKIAASVGSFLLTGKDILFIRGKGISLAVGSFILTGKDIGLTSVRSMVASVGLFILTGKDVILKYSRGIVLEVGRFILSGKDIKFDRGLRNKTKHSAAFTNKEKSDIGRSGINKTWDEATETWDETDKYWEDSELTSFTNKAKNQTIFTNK